MRTKRLTAGTQRTPSVAESFTNQQLVVDQRGGAGGTIAAEIIARSAPDVPTLAESGIAGFEEVGGHMIMISGATPREIVTVRPPLFD